MEFTALESIKELQNAVAVMIEKQSEREVSDICRRGFEDFSNAMLQLQDCDMELLLNAKEGGSIYDQPLSIYNTIQAAATEMVAVREQKMVDWSRYAALTGHDLWSKVSHEADSKIKVKKALVDGQYITSPLIREAQERRNSLTQQYDAGRAAIARILQQTGNVVSKGVKPLLDRAKEDLKLVKDTIKGIEDSIAEMVIESKHLEKEYLYSFDEKGKRVYNKDSEYNRWYAETLKMGRTALNQFKKYETIFGIDSIIPLNEVREARALFGM